MGGMQQDLFGAASGGDWWTVTRLVRRIRQLLESGLGEVGVEGEVSNLRRQPSGHWYFTLKDEGAQISCVMFGARTRPGSAFVVDGALVRVKAETGLYEARGQLQITVQSVAPAGAGGLQARFEALKRKLQEEGLFDADRKKPLPRFPRTVGVITSESGAALQDMLKVIGRRAPWVRVVLYPVRVQGKGAERGIADAVRRMGRPADHGMPRCDVLIVGRGGGSLEDLWCFNEEVLARAIAGCPLPVISAVGHETDFTISDFVADVRAPTPSAAAEIAVPDGDELREMLFRVRRRMRRAVAVRLDAAGALLEVHRRGVIGREGLSLLREAVVRVDMVRARLRPAARAALEDMGLRLAAAKGRHLAVHPANLLERREQGLRALRTALVLAASSGLSSREEGLVRLSGMLRALGPESVFQRGFSLTTDLTGRIVRDGATLRKGDRIRIRFASGSAEGTVDFAG
jgi:exodeoxyribonuclease VII large subunit